MRGFFNTEPDHLGLHAHNLNKLHALIQRGGGGTGGQSLPTHWHSKQHTDFVNLMYVTKKMAASCYGESISAHSIINLH